jgi:hypothetical protein
MLRYRYGIWDFEYMLLLDTFLLALW